MDKLLCTLGMGLIVVFIKMKNWLESFAGLVKGDDGFVMILGVCMAALAIASIVLLISSRRKTA